MHCPFNEAQVEKPDHCIAIKEMAQRPPNKIHVPFCTVPGTVYLGSI